MLSLQTTQPAGTQQKQKLVIGHYDAHGVASSVARAKAVNTTRIIAKYPDTSPERLPDLIDTFFPSLIQHSIDIIDIPVDIKNPTRYVNAIKRLADNTSVTIFDHHESDIRFAGSLPGRVLLFSNATAMAEAIAQGAPEEYVLLAYIGVVADRDASILRRFSKIEVERVLLPMANKLDVLVRQDTEKTTEELLNQGIEYLRRVDVVYPPESLVASVKVVKKGYNTILVETNAQQLQQWSWKTLEQIALQQQADYVVAITSLYDRATNTYVPGLQIIKYWLSQRPEPLDVVKSVVSGRQVIGHPDAFSVRVLDVDDARRIADQVFEALDSTESRVSHLIEESSVANAVRADYNEILNRLTQILSSMEKMYSEYLELKRKQVELLERMNANNRSVRAD